jgi:hypothetical protein
MQQSRHVSEDKCQQTGTKPEGNMDYSSRQIQAQVEFLYRIKFVFPKGAFKVLRSRNSSDHITKGYMLDDRGSISGSDKRFISFSITPRLPLVYM